MSPPRSASAAAAIGDPPAAGPPRASITARHGYARPEGPVPAGEIGSDLDAGQTAMRGPIYGGRRPDGGRSRRPPLPPAGASRPAPARTSLHRLETGGPGLQGGAAAPTRPPATPGQRHFRRRHVGRVRHHEVDPAAKVAGRAAHHEPPASRTRAAGRPPSPARLAPATSRAPGEHVGGPDLDPRSLGGQRQGDGARPGPEVDRNQAVRRRDRERQPIELGQRRLRPPARSRAVG